MGMKNLRDTIWRTIYDALVDEAPVSTALEHVSNEEFKACVKGITNKVCHEIVSHLERELEE